MNPFGSVGSPVSFQPKQTVIRIKAAISFPNQIAVAGTGRVK